MFNGLPNPEHFEDPFAMVHLSNLGQYVELARQKRIHGRDVLVFLALVRHINPMTGRVNVTLRQIAEELGQSHQNVCTFFNRLQKENLAVRCRVKNSREVYFLLNPWVVSVGGRSKQAQLWHQFKLAKESGEAPPEERPVVEPLPDDPAERMAFMDAQMAKRLGTDYRG